MMLRPIIIALLLVAVAWVFYIMIYPNLTKLPRRPLLEATVSSEPGTCCSVVVSPHSKEW